MKNISPQSIFATLILVAMLLALSPRASNAVDVFDYCLDHQDRCALSVTHLTEGWERHLNADTRA